MAQDRALTGLNNNSHLSFPLGLSDGTVIATVGEAATFLARLPLEQRDKSHWTIAIRMLNNALKEPTYLKTATMSLQTALVLDGIFASPPPSDNP
jgi:hypothetical protein